MEIIDEKSYKELLNKVKVNGGQTANERIEKFFHEIANKHIKSNDSSSNRELISQIYKSTMGPYYQYATEFYHEELREEVKQTRNFLSESFKKSSCIHQQTDIDDIVHNIRKGLSISRFGKLHARENILIKSYINGHNTLCKQTIITLLHSFRGIKNFINGIAKGIERCYEYEQIKLGVFILKQCFAYPNILKKLVSTNDIFESFCGLWMNIVKRTQTVFIARNNGATFPLLLKDDKYDMELLLLELSCLFLRTSYCWRIPKYYKHISCSIKRYELFKLLCKWLNARTAKWDHHRICVLTALSYKNPTDKYQQICHQTNYIFQCLINCINSTQVRMVNGGLRLSLTKLEMKAFKKTCEDNIQCLLEHNLSAVCMQVCMDNVTVESPNGEIHEVFPGIKCNDLKKIRIKWKYKLLECQSSNCQKRYTKKNRHQLRKCSHCKITFYCSRHCQKYDWKYKHKFECNSIV